VPTPAEAHPGKPTLAAVVPTGGTKQLILDTALRLFDEQGYDATSLRQIAEAVGMTKAAVYYHYPAKEHLLLELTRPMLDALGELVTEMRTGAAESTTALAAYLDLFLDHLPVVLLLARDPATQNNPDVGQRARTLVDAVQRLVAGTDATTDRTVRTACALGVIHAVATLPPEVARTNRDVIFEAALAALDPRQGSTVSG
jgi:AcrR family transcriptional regulator